MAAAVPAAGVGSPRCCHRGAAPLTWAAARGAAWRGVPGGRAGVRQEGRRRAGQGRAEPSRARPAGRRLRRGVCSPEVWGRETLQRGGALRARERRAREHPPAGPGERGGGAAGQGRAGQGGAAPPPSRTRTQVCGAAAGSSPWAGAAALRGGKAAPAEERGEEAAAGAGPTFPLPARPPAWAGGERRGDARRWRLCSAAERRRRSRCGRRQPAPLRGRPCPPFPQGGPLARPRPPPGWRHPPPAPRTPPSGRGCERTAAPPGAAGRTPVGLRKPGLQRRSRRAWVSGIPPKKKKLWGGRVIAWCPSFPGC